MSDQEPKKTEVKIPEPRINVSENIQVISGIINTLDNLLTDMKENSKDLEDLKKKKAELFATI
jgi:hypothetical protein